MSEYIPMFTIYICLEGYCNPYGVSFERQTFIHESIDQVKVDHCRTVLVAKPLVTYAHRQAVPSPPNHFLKQSRGTFCGTWQLLMPTKIHLDS